MENKFEILLELTVILSVVSCCNGCNVNFSSSPRSVQAQVGDSVSFTCDIANDPYLSRQFIHYSLDGRIFRIFANEPAVIIRGFERVLDPTGAPNTLHIAMVRAEHAGQYACSAIPDLRALNCFGNTTIYTAMNATLSVIGLPKIKSSEPTSVYIANISTDLLVRLHVSGESLNISLIKVSDNIGLSQTRYWYFFNEMYLELTVTDLRKSDAGQYLVVATNMHGSDSIMITIQPVEHPIIVKPPVNQLAERLGENIIFTCSARGFPCPTISWEHNMEPVPGDYAVVTNNCTNDTVTSMLTVRNVNSNDSGTFSCIATVNPGGENNSFSVTQSARLIVGLADSGDLALKVTVPLIVIGVIAGILVFWITNAIRMTKRKRRKTDNSETPACNLESSPHPTDLKLQLQPIQEDLTHFLSPTKQDNNNEDTHSSVASTSQLTGVIQKIPDSLKIPATQLKLASKPVSHGEMGIVYKGHLLDWNEIPLQGVAVKTLKGLYSASETDSLISEIFKMKDFHHPHVMPLIGVCLDTGFGVSIVMPLMANGSLLDYMKKEREQICLSADCDQNKIRSVRRLILRMCHQIALGMEYLAKQKFIHRDLAARNCMLDRNGNIKVGDFGLAEDIYATGYFRQGDRANIKLPFKWMAIESLNDAIFTEKTDVWSYGVTMWEVFSCGRIPYPAVDPLSLIRLLEEGRRLDMPLNAACSAEIFTVMQKCWLNNPDDRPTFSELALTMEDMLTEVSDYLELKMDLKEDPENPGSLFGGLSNVATMDENTAYNAACDNYKLSLHSLTST